LLPQATPAAFPVTEQAPAPLQVPLATPPSVLPEQLVDAPWKMQFRFPSQ
jgi:hypothetical protein